MLSVIETKKLKDITGRILHVPGNYNGGILEMTLVLDFRLKKEYIKETAKIIKRNVCYDLYRDFKSIT